MAKKLLLILLLGILIRCSSDEEYSEYKSLPGHWPLEETLEFSLPEMDSSTTYNVFLNVRNTNDFKFSNLFLIVSMTFPHGKVVTDTLEYQMALPDGTWLGTGGSVKENKLWYKEKIRFVEEGNYSLKVRHAMRNNAAVEGVTELEGITDVGVSIEKSN